MEEDRNPQPGLTGDGKVELFGIITVQWGHDLLTFTRKVRVRPTETSRRRRDLVCAQLLPAELQQVPQLFYSAEPNDLGGRKATEWHMLITAQARRGRRQTCSFIDRLPHPATREDAFLWARKVVAGLVGDSVPIVHLFSVEPNVLGDAARTSPGSRC